MKTHHYNPSVFEVKLASAITNCKAQIQEQIGDEFKIVDTEDRMNKDNPMLVFHLEDKDGDPHEVVVKIIQRPDKV